MARPPVTQEQRDTKRIDFINKAKSIHGDKYDYSKVEFVNTKTKVCIICPEHGEFWQTPEKHLSGQGCPSCAKTKKSDTTSFIEKAKAVHGDRYNYSKVVYVNNKTKVCIICPDHGEFWQDPHNHLKGKGCPLCGKQKVIDEHPTRLGLDEFIRRAKEIHGDKYDYSQIAAYNHGKEEVTIVCPVHGPFKQSFNVHLMGCGCPQCGREVTDSKRIKGKEHFIQRAKAIHGDKYDYSLVPEVFKLKEYIPIICHHKNFNGEEHGVFYQMADKHACGCGCPRCAHFESKAQNDIEAFVRSLLPDGTQIVSDDRTVLDGQELDVYIPSQRLAIEYNGMIWHSEYANKNRNYHLAKLDLCSEKGVRLIQIMEAEYLVHRDIVEDKIRNILGCNGNKEKIHARKCTVQPIDWKIATDFLNRNHIQGFVSASVYLGAYHGDKLVGVMSFMEESKGKWNLNRFATDINYHCVGLGGKLFAYFVRNYEFDEVKSFADRRWTFSAEDNLYTRLGFKLDGVTPPDYRYTRVPTDYIHKFQFRKERLMKMFPDAGLTMDMTELEMTQKLGFYRIWDCGLYRYVYKKEG